MNKLNQNWNNTYAFCNTAGHIWNILQGHHIFYHPRFDRSTFRWWMQLLTLEASNNTFKNTFTSSTISLHEDKIEKAQ